MCTRHGEPACCGSCAPLAISGHLLEFTPGHCGVDGECTCGDLRVIVVRPRLEVLHGDSGALKHSTHLEHRIWMRVACRIFACLLHCFALLPSHCLQVCGTATVQFQQIHFNSIHKSAIYMPFSLAQLSPASPKACGLTSAR